MKKYIMSIDQGTTSSRAIVFDKAGRVAARSQKEVSQNFPHPGWVEQDPLEIWQSVLSVVAGAMIDGHMKPDEINCLGISNQRETTIIWEKETGRPIYPAIVWQSKQTSGIAEAWHKKYAALIQAKTGLIVDAYFSATKIRWILDHLPGAQARAEKGELLFGTIDTWLLWKLTDGKVHATDYTNASRTMLFNIYTLTWDAELLKLFNIPEALLPKVCENSAIFGYTKDYHFYGEEVPIAGLVGDQQAALIGQQAFEKGMVKNTYGTGAFIVMNTGTEAINNQAGLLTTIAYGLDGKVNYALEGSIFVAGSAVQWLRDGLHFFQDAADSEALAEEVNDSEGVYVVPAFTGLGAPYWDQEARGAIFGLTRGTTSAHLTRATLEAIAYQTCDVALTMEKVSHIPLKELHVDGGASRNDLLMQFQADILNLPVRRRKFTESTSLGAAIMAALAVDFWQPKDLPQLKTLEDSRTFMPQMTEDERAKRYNGWQQAVQATMSYKNN